MRRWAMFLGAESEQQNESNSRDGFDGSPDGNRESRRSISISRRLYQGVPVALRGAGYGIPRRRLVFQDSEINSNDGKEIPGPVPLHLLNAPYPRLRTTLVKEVRGDPAAMPNPSVVAIRPPKPDLSQLDADIVICCPVCMETYSNTRYPIVSGSCGHSICIVCESSSRTDFCATCGVKVVRFSIGGANGPYLLRKNYALLDLLNLRAQEEQKFLVEMKKSEKERIEKEQLMVENDRLLQELAECKKKEMAQDFIDCSKCETREKMERMMICETCIRKGEEVDWKDVEEEKTRRLFTACLHHISLTDIFFTVEIIITYLTFLRSFLCAFCSYCNEDHKGHLLREYLPWKIRKIVASTVSDGKSTVLSMDEVCFHEIEKGKEELKVWLEEMDSFRDVDCKSYEEAQSTASVLREESNAVCNASERTLPTLRMFTKVIRNSTARLNLLKKNEE